MAKVTTTPGFKKMVKRRLKITRRRETVEMFRTLIQGILHDTPVESGHAHPAWLKAIAEAKNEIPGSGLKSLITSAAAPHQSKASDVPGSKQFAEQHGEGSFFEGDTETTVEILNRLGFVEDLEYGGLIVPISPGGAKRDKVFPGRLLSRRTVHGTGVLRWKDKSGVVRQAPTRAVGPGKSQSGRPVRDALQNVKRLVKNRGGKVVS